MTGQNDDAYELYCSLLDAWGRTLSMGFQSMRLGFVMHGHRDGFEGWLATTEGDAAAHLASVRDVADFDARAQQMLARFSGMNAETIVPLRSVQPAPGDPSDNDPALV
ncbi:MAG: hypothetical protein AAF830_08370 [Pseudomonadota bacterium]